MKWDYAEENSVNVGLINISLPFGVSPYLLKAILLALSKTIHLLKVRKWIDNLRKNDQLNLIWNWCSCYSKADKNSDRDTQNSIEKSETRERQRGRKYKEKEPFRNFVSVEAAATHQTIVNAFSHFPSISSPRFRFFVDGVVYVITPRRKASSLNGN